MMRLNRRPVAVDIAHEMLAVTRERATRRPIPAVAGDLEHLPFADGVFDKAVCLSALHHVPDMAAALREIARVLSPTGVAVFSEPGAGHATMAASVKATRDFGVLEQEVLIEPFTEMCVRAGFRHAYVCPMTHVIPEFELTAEDWRAWRALAASKRPARALGKMWRAALELVGAGKQGPLFEEAFAMRLVRLLRGPVDEHPFILATKSDERRRPRPVHRAGIVVQSVEAAAPQSAPMTAAVTVTNTGNVRWPASTADGVGQVQIGIQLLDAASRVIDPDFVRWRLPHDVGPDESLNASIAFAAPAAAGEYQLKFDLVAEGITWFEPGGTVVAIRPLRVGPQITE
jgi:SAM-dependent methyltransferase